MRSPNILRSRRIVGVALVFAMALSPIARAGDDAVPSRLRAYASEAPGPGRAPAGLTQRQLDDFASLVGEDEQVVVQRLLWAPSLFSLAAAAADARMARRRTGRVLTIGGFSLMGIGLLVGGAIVISGITPDHSCSFEGGSDCSSGGNDGEVHAGFLVMLVSAGVGLGLGVPGIVKTARPSETEKEALERYSNANPRPGPMPYAPGARAAASLGRTMTLPLLSFSF